MSRSLVDMCTVFEEICFLHLQVHPEIHNLSGIHFELYLQEKPSNYYYYYYYLILILFFFTKVIAKANCITISYTNKQTHKKHNTTINKKFDTLLKFNHNSAK